MSLPIWAHEVEVSLIGPEFHLVAEVEVIKGWTEAMQLMVEGSSTLFSWRRDPHHAATLLGHPRHPRHPRPTTFDSDEQNRKHKKSWEEKDGFFWSICSGIFSTHTHAISCSPQ